MSKPPLNNSNQIVAFMHCKQCLDDLHESKLKFPPGDSRVIKDSPAEYARLSVGWTSRGFQVWCERHQCNVINIDFEGIRHPADTTRKR